LKGKDPHMSKSGDGKSGSSRAREKKKRRGASLGQRKRGKKRKGVPPREGG